MRKSEKPAAAPRRVWRMTADAPHGEFVDADEKREAVTPPAPDELYTSSWLRSSYDLLNGLEVTETSPGELPEAYFGGAAAAPPPALARERPQDAGEWIKRFAIRLGELDRQRDPRQVIDLAKRQWMTKHSLLPEEAAEAEHRGRPRR